MFMRCRGLVCAAVLATAACLCAESRVAAPAGAEPAAERGRTALLTRCFSAPFVSRARYETLWKQWGLSARPEDFDAQVRNRYGLHEAPYPNDGLPMGLRPTVSRRGAAVGIDCMLCHGGALFGKSYVGLPNTSLDLYELFRDLDLADGGFGIFPYRLSHVRGTTESTATGVFVISLRKPDLSMLLPPANLGPIPDQAVEDAPAWWLLKRKRTMYYNGQIDAHAVRPLMMFMLSPGADAARFAREESTFADIRKYLQTLEAPKYPFPVDGTLAERGQTVFEENCAKCHGTYGPDADYPNRVVPLAKIGTDPTLVRGLTPKIERHFRESWFSNEAGPGGKPYPLKYNTGYQAPPLDGVWATAPYLHNGSVPTLHDLLKSDGRPKVFTRSYGTALEDYDVENVGWKVRALKEPPRAASPREARQVYDTTQPGRSNAGHTFGDALTDDERRAVIEYLKTL
jgi:mono/diheme cytochrome c family protein